MSVNFWDLDTSKREDELEMKLLEVRNDASKLALYLWHIYNDGIKITLNEKDQELIEKYLD